MKALAVLENDKVGVIELEKPENLSENEVLVKIKYLEFPRSCLKSAVDKVAIRIKNGFIISRAAA